METIDTAIRLMLIGQIILISYGADLSEGGEGYDADIRSDELSNPRN